VSRGTGSLIGSPENSKQTDQASPQIEGKLIATVPIIRQHVILSNPLVNQSIQNGMRRIADRCRRIIGHSLFKNRGDRKVRGGREVSRNIEEWILGARGQSMMAENEIDEIGWMGRSKKQKEDGMKSRKVEDGIGNVGRTR
jgi:hypothetical protein